MTQETDERSRLKVAEGISEGGVVVGNTYDKYGTRNPIAVWMVENFARSLSTLVQRSNPDSIHEVGCGEGHWVLRWYSEGLDVRGSDFSSKVIEIARDNARQRAVPDDRFKVLSIYDLDSVADSADLIVCCEVLEHLEEPQRALESLQRVTRNQIILSVPREPVWRVMNLARGKYLAQLGNTPGHIQHWSRRSFVGLISRYFEVVEVLSPLPWTMLLCKKR